MTNATAQHFSDHMQVLFDVGTCTGMTDGQLTRAIHGWA